jgi:hypothetical protein
LLDRTKATLNVDFGLCNIDHPEIALRLLSDNCEAENTFSFWTSLVNEKLNWPVKSVRTAMMVKK